LIGSANGRFTLNLLAERTPMAWGKPSFARQALDALLDPCVVLEPIFVQGQISDFSIASANGAAHSFRGEGEVLISDQMFRSLFSPEEGERWMSLLVEIYHSPEPSSPPEALPRVVHLGRHYSFEVWARRIDEMIFLSFRDITEKLEISRRAQTAAEDVADAVRHFESVQRGPSLDSTADQLSRAVKKMRQVAGSINHLGIEVNSTDEVIAATARLAAEGVPTEIEEQTTCCYAVQDKVWVSAPDAEAWEVYTVLADAQGENALGGDEKCCTSDSAERKQLPALIALVDASGESCTPGGGCC
jgi:hypothetical protein